MSVEALAAQEAALAVRLGDALARAVIAAWQAVRGLDDAAMERWLASILPLIDGAQRQAGATTSAYLSRSLSEAKGTSVVRAVAPELITGAIIRRGAPPAKVYARPMIQARALVAQGMPYREALRRSQGRAVQLARTDLQLARTHAAQAVLGTEPGVVGYRRVLTGSETCGLCIVASTQRYHKAELMPIHPGCDCGIAPIIGTEDPGRVINKPLLDAVHQRIAEDFGPAAVDAQAGHDIYDRNHPYRRLIETFDHGEYGPTLAKRGQRHLTSAAADDRPDLGNFMAGKMGDGWIQGKTDWGKAVGKVDEYVEVSRGPFDPTVGRIPGQGVAYVTTDNRLFYAEYPLDPDGLIPQEMRYQAAIRNRLEKLRQYDAESLPPEFKGPEVVMSVNTSSAQDTFLSERYGKRFTTAANAGGDRVIHFNGQVHQEIAWHENGHHVAYEINQRYRKETSMFSYIGDHNDPGEAWARAKAADEAALVRWSEQGRFAEFDPIDYGPGSHPALVRGYGTGPDGKTRAAVTEYGALNNAEDFAESWRLAIKSTRSGGIATYRRPDGFLTQAAFSDLYPERMRYLETVASKGGFTLPFRRPKFDWSRVTVEKLPYSRNPWRLTIDGIEVASNDASLGGVTIPLSFRLKGEATAALRQLQLLQ